MTLSEPVEFQSITGRGVMAHVDGVSVRSGNPALMAEHNVDTI